LLDCDKLYSYIALNCQRVFLFSLIFLNYNRTALRRKALPDSFYEKYQKIGVDGLPKYAQLRETLRAAIKDGYWTPGSQLPPEAEIVHMVGMSLGTVQKALRALVDDGALIRRQGHGTFVVGRERRIDPLWHLRFLKEEDGTYLQLYPKVLSRRLVKSRAGWAKAVGKGAKRLIQIDRTIDVGHEFTVYSKFFLSEKFKGFIEKPVEELERSNFRSILNEEFNVAVATMSHSFRVEAFPGGICKAIGVQRKAVGLVYEILARDPSLKPVYYQEICIPPNRRRLHILDTSKNACA
jgi:GntR family transcriptional regulator